MNNYLLLRNNKETGPFSLDELVNKGLKAYDLIWIEGKSAAWRYPSEIAELKAYAPAIEEQPQERLLKKESVTATSNICNAEQYNTTPTTAPKPRIRIKAEWSKVQQPVASTVMEAKAEVAAITEKPAVSQQRVMPVTQPATTSAKPSWENSWLDWQEEQNAVKQASKQAHVYTAYNIPGQKKLDEQPVLETKFSQSLSEIKEKYAATVLKAKSKAGELNKFKTGIIAALLAIPLLGVGMWLGYKFTAQDNAGKVAATQVAAEKKPLQPDVSGEEPMSNIPAPKTDSKEIIPGFDDNTSKTEKPVTRLKAKTTTAKHTAIVKPVVPAPNTPAIQQTANNTTKQQPINGNKLPATSTSVADRTYAVTQPAAANTGERNKSINPAIIKQSIPLPGGNSLPLPPPPPFVKTTKSTDSRPVYNHLPASVTVDDYVSVDVERPFTQAVQDAKLNVENITDIPLDLVVIDLQYFDGANRFKNGQTIRIKNIPAGETVNVKVPDNANASKLRYKVSLVSADRKNVYIVGEDE